MQPVNRERESFAIYGWIGLCVILTAEILLVSQTWIIPTFFTPIVWSGYILFVDALNSRLHGESLIRSRTREFLLMLPWSVFCWVIFELYNLHLENWRYLGLPQDLLLRLVGYGWSFATIFPAILGTADLLQPLFRDYRISPRKFSRGSLQVQIFFGLCCLIVPLLVSQSVGRYLMGFVWLGFAFLLEPVNYLLGGRSLFAYFAQGEVRQLLGLIAAGFVCGFLWEFWNYWAGAKWVYTLPSSLAGPRIFEMPVLGFLGFIPFAVECHAMNNFLFTITNQNKNVSLSYS